jgi:hypothetical protein
LSYNYLVDTFPPGTIDRFWEKVLKTTDCWIWTGARNRKGYGRFSVRVGERIKNYRAHRFAWEMAHGEAPPTNRELCHTCDVRECVKPSHLFIGTHGENMEDAQRKGRLYTAPEREHFAAYGASSIDLGEEDDDKEDGDPGGNGWRWEDLFD